MVVSISGGINGGKERSREKKTVPRSGSDSLHWRVAAASFWVARGLERVKGADFTEEGDAPWAPRRQSHLAGEIKSGT